MLRPTGPKNRFYTASGMKTNSRRPGLSVRRRFGEATFAGTLGNGRGAPIAVI
jgi:hypothetical protein